MLALYALYNCYICCFEEFPGPPRLLLSVTVIVITIVIFILIPLYSHLFYFSVLQAFAGLKMEIYAQADV